MTVKNHKGEIKSTVYIDAITRNRMMRVAPADATFKQTILLACQAYIDQNYDSYLARMRKEKEFSNKLDVIDNVE